MKNIQKQNLTINILIFILLILFFVSGTMMLSQHHQIHSSPGTVQENNSDTYKPLWKPFSD